MRIYQRLYVHTHKSQLTFIYWSLKFKWTINCESRVSRNGDCEDFFLLECDALYEGADKSLARPGRNQSRKHVRDARDFKTSRRELSSRFFLQGKAPKEILAIRTETLAYFLRGRAKD